MAVLTALSTAAGCQEKPSNESVAPSAAPSATPASSGLEAFLADKKAPLTPAIAEQLLTGLASCQLDERGIKERCDAYQQFTRSRSRRFAVKKPLAELAALGKKHLADPSPAVRLESAKLCGTMFASDAELEKLVIEQARKEQVPTVLVTQLRVLGSSERTSDELGKLLLSKVDDASAPVRMEAMGWLLAGKTAPGGFERVLEKLDKDPSLDVRSHLCSRLYGTADDRALPVLTKYLRAKDTPKQLYEGCFRGLIDAWTGYPKPQKPSEKAYRLTLELLDQTPRSNERPPYSAVTLLRSAKTEFPESDKAGKAWLSAVKAWYDKNRLLKSLESLAGDHDANLITRTSALDVMKELGAPKVAFSRVAAKYSKATGQEENLKRRAEQIAKGTLASAGPGKPAPSAR